MFKWHFKKCANFVLPIVWLYAKFGYIYIIQYTFHSKLHLQKRPTSWMANGISIIHTLAVGRVRLGIGVSMVHCFELYAHTWSILAATAVGSHWAPCATHCSIEQNTCSQSELGQLFTLPPPSPVLGWSDFEEKTAYTFHVMPNCCRNLIPKCHVLMMLLNLTVTLKTSEKNVFLSLWQGGTYSFICVKAKNEEKLKQKLYRPNTGVPILRAWKKIFKQS